jgi:hypothetical protein
VYVLTVTFLYEFQILGDTYGSGGGEEYECHEMCSHSSAICREVKDDL